MKSGVRITSYEQISASYSESTTENDRIQITNALSSHGYNLGKIIQIVGNEFFFQGYDNKKNRRCCIKILRYNGSKQLAELKSRVKDSSFPDSSPGRIASLQHHILTITDSFNDDSYFYAITNYCSLSLSDFIIEHQPFTQDAILKFIRDVYDTLDIIYRSNYKLFLLTIDNFYYNYYDNYIYTGLHLKTMFSVENSDISDSNPDIFIPINSKFIPPGLKDINNYVEISSNIFSIGKCILMCMFPEADISDSNNMNSIEELFNDEKYTPNMTEFILNATLVNHLERYRIDEILHHEIFNGDTKYDIKDYIGDLYQHMQNKIEDLFILKPEDKDIIECDKLYVKLREQLSHEDKLDFYEGEYNTYGYPTSDYLINAPNNPSHLEAFTDIISIFTHITILDLTKFGLDDSSFKIVAKSFQYFTNLQKISLASNNLTETSMFTFTLYFRYMKNLEYINIAFNPIKQGVSVLSKSLHELPALRYLNLSSVDFEENGVNALINQFPYLSNLTHLYFGFNSISYEMFVKLFHNISYLYNIKELYLNNCLISKKIIQLFLDYSLNLKQLMTLDISGNVINRECADYLFDHLERIPKLEILRISSNHLPKGYLDTKIEEFSELSILEY